MHWLFFFFLILFFSFFPNMYFFGFILCVHTSPSRCLLDTISTFTASFWLSHLNRPCSRNDTTGTMGHHEEDGQRWICNSCVRGGDWAPRAVCLWIYLSTLNQILLHSLHSAVPPTFYIQFDDEGYRTKWKVWGFTPPPHPLNPPSSAHLLLSPGLDHAPITPTTPITLSP